jgi:hypothetical protein
MKRLLAILVLGFLAFASVGITGSTAGAGPANCAPGSAAVLDGANTFDANALLAGIAVPAAQVEGPAAKNRSLPTDGPQYACNRSCARACSQRFGNCPTRQCRQQFNACVRSCGC